MTDYAVELKAPNIEPYRAGNTGINYVTSFESGRPGPHVVVNALTHGNEICGAIALDFLFRNKVRPTGGTLTLSFANVEAFKRFDPAHPNQSRFVEEDFNRVWDVSTLNGDRKTVDLARARVLRQVIDTADLLLDIHSMQNATEPLTLCGMTQKGRDLAVSVGVPNLIVADEGHAAGRRMRDYGGFSDPASTKNALLIECGQHWETRAADVAIESTLRFLQVAGMLDKDFAAEHLKDPVPEPKVIEITKAITVKHESFDFVADYVGMETIEKAGTVIAHDGPKEVRTPYDDCVLIMPSRRLKPGNTAVRLGRRVA